MERITRPINKIILHCTATFASQKVTMADIKRWHVAENGWEDVGYHFVIDQQGNVHQGRDINKQGAHCKGFNQMSVGICYIGGLDDETGSPMDTRTPAQRSAMMVLVKDIMRKCGLRIEHVHCHNEFSKRSCPCFTRADFVKEYWQSF